MSTRLRTAVASRYRTHAKLDFTEALLLAGLAVGAKLLHIW